MAMSLWPHFFGPSCMFRTQSFALNPYYSNYAEIIFWLSYEMHYDLPELNNCREVNDDGGSQSWWHTPILEIETLLLYAALKQTIDHFDLKYDIVEIDTGCELVTDEVAECDRQATSRPGYAVERASGTEILPFISTGYLHASCCKSMQIIKKPSLRKRPRASVCRSLLCFKTVNFTRCLSFTTGRTMKVCRKL